MKELRKMTGDTVYIFDNDKSCWLLGCDDKSRALEARESLKNETFRRIREGIPISGLYRKRLYDDVIQNETTQAQERIA